MWNKANKVTHSLAKFAPRVKDELTWLKEFSLPIASLVVKNFFFKFIITDSYFQEKKRNLK